MSAVGSANTRLVVLRGDSGSGKTTTATSLRPLLRNKTALIHQDHFRRTLLAGGEKNSRSADAAALIDTVARQSLDLGYDVILDGVLNLRDYAGRLEQLWRDHRGVTRIYQFDVGFEETVRRHETRELRHAFTPEQMRAWHDGWQPLEFVEESRIGPEETLPEIVARIVADLREGSSAPVAHSRRPKDRMVEAREDAEDVAAFDEAMAEEGPDAPGIR